MGGKRPRRPKTATVPPRLLRGRQPPNYGHPPPRPCERRATNDLRTGVRHSPAHHDILDAHQLLVHPRKSVGLANVGAPAPTSGGHHNPPRSHTAHTLSPHRTPKQAGRAPRPTTPTLQGGTSVYAGPGILHGSRAQHGHRIPGPAPPAPERRPMPRSTASNKGMGTTPRLAHILPQGGQDGPLALLQGQYRRPSLHGLCQTRSALPTQSNTQPPTRRLRSGSHTH